MKLPFLAQALSERSFNRVVVGAISAGFLLIVIAGTAAGISIAQSQDHSNWVRHTYEVESAIGEFEVLIDRIETARRGILLRDDARMSAVFRQTLHDTLPLLDHIRRLTADNVRQQRRIAALRPLTERHLAALRRSVALAEGGRRPAAAAAFVADPDLDMLFARREQAQAMMDEEARLLLIRTAERQASVNLFYMILTATGVLLILVAAGTIWIIRRYTRDLTVSRNRLRLLNEDLEGAVRERTVDLQRANDEIQRFAYIVSHDLRSPLVNVMGFTAELETATKTLGALIDRAEAAAPQLVDEPSRIATREDLPEAIRFIRTSTQKMDRLINAILRLSREGRRTITPERVEIEAIAHSVADSLRHRADEIGAEIRIAPRLPIIVTDRLGIEQILSNLVENAVKYLQPGRPGIITIRGSISGSRAIIEVVDNGRGIDPRDHERVFDLFRRSGIQDQPGEGIGLAHVRAMAYRLDGTINLESRFGEGTTFRVDLPTSISGENAPS